MKLKKLVTGLVIFTIAATFMACSSKSDGDAQAAEKSASSTEYNAQYNFSTKLMDGSDISLTDYKGKVLIVDLWDTWCPPCRMEIPHFIELYSEYKDKDFVMLGLAFGREGPQAVEQFIKDNGINYVNGFVNEEVIAKLGRPSGIPTTYVIDQYGNIYKKYVGYKEKSVFEADIKALLNI